MHNENNRTLCSPTTKSTNPISFCTSNTIVPGETPLPIHIWLRLISSIQCPLSLKFAMSDGPFARCLEPVQPLSTTTSIQTLIAIFIKQFTRSCKGYQYIREYDDLNCGARWDRLDYVDRGDQFESAKCRSINAVDRTGGMIRRNRLHKFKAKLERNLIFPVIYKPIKSLLLQLCMTLCWKEILQK